MTAEVPSRRPTAALARSEAASCAARRGSVLVEFALVAIAFYLLLAGTLELGKMITTAQVVQNAARTAARELALLDLPATMSFQEALACPTVRQRIYDPALLAVPWTGSMPNTASWPSVNRLLLPLMVVERVGTSDYLHFPGAVVRLPNGDLSVAVPKVVSRGAEGAETIEWVGVLEEVRPDSADPNAGPFSLASTGPERGLVAVRINAPYQATTLSGYQPSASGGTGPQNAPILANDGSVTQLNNAPGQLVGSDGVGTYSGPYGLGKFYALKKEVRPFRRLISGQSVFRREVFTAGTSCP
jgi:hypothetical protein